MKKVLVIMGALFFCANVGFAAFSSADMGTTSAAFLKLGAGARPTGMGDCYAAVADDSTAIYWNPAGLARIEAKNGTATLMHAVWFEDIFYDWVSYARPIKNWGVFGIGVQYLSYGSIDQMDNTGLNTGTFSPTDLAISVAYAKNIKGFDLGVNLKYISSKIVNTATAYAADLGVMKKLMDDKLSLGAAVQNMGTALKYVSDQEPLPFNIKVGGAYKIKSNWLGAIDVNAPIDGPIYYGAGTEYIQRLKDNLVISGRAGYNTRNINTGGLNGFTVGLGIKYLDYAIDYAFVPYGDLGNTNRISLTVAFK